MADCLVITGATATGKSTVAIEVAQRIGGEIISLDSRQVYQGMNIGTAKATPEQRAAVPHHGIDLLPPSQRYNAGKFAQDTRRWISEIRSRERVPVLVGGTGFFLRALTHPMFEEPEHDEERKDALKTFLNQLEHAELLRWLRALDSAGAARLSPQAGRQRIARMIEVVLQTGYTLRWWHEHSDSAQPIVDALTIVLELPRPVLYERINARVQEMIANGLAAEVKSLVDQGYDDHAPGMNTVGYIELLPHLRGESSLEEAVDAIQRATRAYARRQETWFRHQLSEPIVRIDATQPVETIADTIVREWQQAHAHRD